MGNLRLPGKTNGTKAAVSLPDTFHGMAVTSGVPRREGCPSDPVALWHYIKHLQYFSLPTALGNRTWSKWRSHLLQCVHLEQPFPLHVILESIIWLLPISRAAMPLGAAGISSLYSASSFETFLWLCHGGPDSPSECSKALSRWEIIVLLKSGM